jgi:hypothetical protein
VQVGRHLARLTSIVVRLGLLLAATATAAQPGVTLVSTSGIPHHDVGNYTKSQFWHEDLPPGINRTWRRAIDITIGQIASETPTPCSTPATWWAAGGAVTPT